MGHCGKFFNALWATVNFILLCAMGHCGEFGYMLWANEADLVMRHGPLSGMKPYSKDLY
jgi:hypothetical protein